VTGVSATAAPPEPAARRPGPSLAWSLIVGAVGLLVGIVSAVAIVIPLVGVFTSDAYTVPGEIHLHLHDTRYTVYQRTGDRSPFGISNPDDSTVRLSPEMLTVTAPDGSTVPVLYDSRSESITRGSAEYTSSLTFDPPAGGDYVLQFTRVSTTVIVARSVSDAIRGVLVWFGVGAIGGAILLAGIVMLIVGVVRRGRAKRAAYAAAWGAAPGWYGPPPQWTPPAGAPGYPPAYPPAYPPPPQSPPAYPPPPPPPAPPQSPPPPPPTEPPAGSS
jgi:hypothetical protein